MGPTRSKVFDWIVSGAQPKNIPEVRKIIQEWAQREEHQIERIWYCFEEKGQALVKVKIDYTTKY